MSINDQDYHRTPVSHLRFRFFFLNASSHLCLRFVVLRQSSREEPFKLQLRGLEDDEGLLEAEPVGDLSLGLAWTS